jgi:serine/threonine-protein kinase RIO1
VSDSPISTVEFPPVELSEQQLIGKGTRRYCYQFPGRDELCIKVPKAKKNGYLQQRREVRYYQKLYRRGVPTRLITRYHGTVETSEGTGYVYDAVRDPDGRVSRQMIEYLDQQPEHYREYLRLFKLLENYLFDNRVIFYDLSPYNILCRKTGEGRFEPYIIDGVGDVVAIPVLNLSQALVRQKIKRRWMRMIRKLSKRYDWMADYHFGH